MKHHLLKAENLHFNFGLGPLLQGVDFSLAAGETVLLAGRNSSGKSTLLRLLAGVLKADQGRLLYGPDLEKRKIAFIPSSLSFYEEWPVARGIDFHCRVFRIPVFDDHLLRLLDIRADQKINSLSAGQRVIFHLSLALALQPELLLLDEVIQAMDLHTREILLEALVDLLAEGYCCLLLVDHSFSETALLPERVLFLEQGRLLLDESLEGLLARVRKVFSDSPPDSRLPVIQQRNLAFGNEYFIYPFEPEMAGLIAGETKPAGLAETMKAFMGGCYDQE